MRNGRIASHTHRMTAEYPPACGPPPPARTPEASRPSVSSRPPPPSHSSPTHPCRGRHVQSHSASASNFQSRSTSQLYSALGLGKRGERQQLVRAAGQGCCSPTPQRARPAPPPGSPPHRPASPAAPHRPSRAWPPPTPSSSRTAACRRPPHRCAARWWRLPPAAGASPAAPRPSPHATPAVGLPSAVALRPSPSSPASVAARHRSLRLYLGISWNLLESLGISQAARPMPASASQPPGALQLQSLWRVPAAAVG